MASVGHVAVGIAAASAYRRDRAVPRSIRWRSMAAWSALSLLPDVDVIGFSLGVRYGDPWGHRGATHSLAMALAAGLAAGLAARATGRPFRRTALFAIAVLASHGLLDTMTDGGLGCALFWPFDLRRYFAPWRPIPVAPIGLSFLSPRGLAISATEVLLFAPLLLYGLRPATLHTRRLPGILTLWLLSGWLIVSDDRVRERIVGVLLREHTAYTDGYSESAFGMITAGESQPDVRARLGPPFGENWVYLPSSESAAATSAASISGCASLRFEREAVVAAFEPEACARSGIRTGTPAGDVRQRLGPPSESCWQYTWSSRGGHYRVRAVCFVGSTVEDVIRAWR